MISQKLFPILVAAALAVPVAATAQQTPTDREDAELVYAQCMRDNGYGEFPDPTPDGGIRFRIAPDTAPRFHKAAEACRHLAPEGLGDEGVTPEQLDALIKLSRCVREHGVADFPDPDADGRYNLRSISTGPSDPRIAAAMNACSELSHDTRIMIGG